ncbi:E3 ubiquitin-protein ligase ring1 [Phtheirospermum japonicum]|uniref:E3 ubiquitin-protein ligase ring1 n=1 Tax=Phtheirospermum japonicum TaxID=374723 RepID=A0A830BY71_9LAMI|nr:E3 ubiquitin-protein ligase ring1 [Phtheirospermum japonicum]
MKLARCPASTYITPIVFPRGSISTTRARCAGTSCRATRQMGFRPYRRRWGY